MKLDDFIRQCAEDCVNGGSEPVTTAYAKPPLGEVIPLHQSEDGADVCLYCGEKKPWKPMDRCPGSREVAE